MSNFFSHNHSGQIQSLEFKCKILCLCILGRAHMYLTIYNFIIYMSNMSDVVEAQVYNIKFLQQLQSWKPTNKPKTLFEVEDPPYTFFWIFNINTFIINTYVPFAKIKSLPTVVRSRSSHILMWLYLLCSLWLLHEGRGFTQCILWLEVYPIHLIGGGFGTVTELFT